jgi:predicted O-methyltransferase YrrM
LRIVLSFKCYTDKLNFRELAHSAVAEHRACQCVEELSALCGLFPNPLRNTLEIGVGDDNGTMWLWKQISERALGVDIKPECRDRDLAHVICADSQDPATVDLVKAHFCGEPLDFLFIDGAHEYAFAKSDYELYGPLVRPGGIIAFHDINEKSPDPVCVGQFWRDLEQQVGTMRLVAKRPGARNPLGIGVVVGTGPWGWDEREGWPF